ncbi:helix-turn-helix domain-containing protein [Streptomyces sp. NPDC051567]|uniref:helix-turn-helix domain-containing protein n=1 Tax=Streptomyces sp. NPDC051567 TaxID=3365660 RepID=UPI0037952BA8
MPRPERLLDPTAGPLENFAHELRCLRKRAGNPSYRIMAKRAHYSVATLSEAARGLHRPSLKVTLAYIAACGGDPELWTRRWYGLGHELEDRGSTFARGQPGHTGPVPARPGPGHRGAPPRDQARRPAPEQRDQGRSPARDTRGEGARGLLRDASAARPARPAPALPTAPDRAPGRAGADALAADERAELDRLRNEVEELRHTNEVLKAASAIFAADLRTTSQVVYNSAGRQDRLA